MAMVIEVPSEIMINHDLVPKAFSLAGGGAGTRLDETWYFTCFLLSKKG